MAFNNEDSLVGVILFLVGADNIIGDFKTSCGTWKLVPALTMRLCDLLGAIWRISLSVSSSHSKKSVGQFG